jgi:hypothetical protein
MGTILSTVKQTAIEAKEYEQDLSETVITNFEFDAEDHYRNAQFYQYEDPPKSQLR